MYMKMESRAWYASKASLVWVAWLVALGCSGGSGGDDAAGSSGLDGSLGGLDAFTVDAGPVIGNDTRTNSCPGPVLASWSVDGVPYVSSTILVLSMGTGWQMTLVECVDDGVDSTLQIADIPGPVAVGSFPISFTVLHGQPASGTAGATWSVTSGGGISDATNYFTDPTHTGVLTITAVDSAASTFSGTFSFLAVNDAGTHVVNVTDGILTNIKFTP